MTVQDTAVVRMANKNRLRILLLALASLIIFTVSLGGVGGAVWAKASTRPTSDKWRDGVEVIVYVKPEATQEQIAAIGEELKRSSEVETVEFVGVEATFKDFQELFKDDPQIRENVSPADLPQSFRIRPKNPDSEGVAALGESFADRDDVYEVQFAPKALLALEGKFDRLGSMFVILALVLLSASLLMILFVIQVAVFARRREIELQQLVGATNSGASQVSGVEQSG